MRKIGQARSKAGLYIEEMHNYLVEKSTTYTLYDGDWGKGKTGNARITPIG